MRNRIRSVLMAFAISAVCLPPAFAQAAGGNQQIFNDERQLLRDQNGQVQQYQQEAQSYKDAVEQSDQKDQSFRLYAEKEIQQLKRIRAAHGSPALDVAQSKQMYALQQWLVKDDQIRAGEQKHIQQLDKAIANLQNQQGATFSDLGSDINNMRQNQERIAEDDRFNQMMRVNMFNELQSEMGAASWGGSPTDGTYNSVGGYGFQGGYGYSYGGGRRGF
jgi:hypothetical protein